MCEVYAYTTTNNINRLSVCSITMNTHVLHVYRTCFVQPLIDMQVGWFYLCVEAMIITNIKRYVYRKRGFPQLTIHFFIRQQMTEPWIWSNN